MIFMIGMFIISGLILCIISIPMILKKVKPNGLYGFRVKKTLENPDIWYAVNCYSGKWLLLIGSIIVVGTIGLSFVPSLTIDTYALGVLAIFFIAFTISIVMSVRYLNSL